MKRVCDGCTSVDHPTALHVNFKFGDGTQPTPDTSTSNNHNTSSWNDGEKALKAEFGSMCTEVCGNPSPSFTGKSCAKVLLVKVYPSSRPEDAILTYAIVDDQSNRSLGTSHHFNLLNSNVEEIEYSLSSCAGSFAFSGRVAENCVVESWDSTVKLSLPSFIECNNIPDIREEIPTPEVARNFPHLRNIETFIPTIYDGRTLLLIGSVYLKSIRS